MLLYCVTRKIEEIEEDTFVVIKTTQKEAYDYIKTIDPEKEKDLMIYPVEV